MCEDMFQSTSLRALPYLAACSLKSLDRKISIGCMSGPSGGHLCLESKSTAWDLRLRTLVLPRLFKEQEEKIAKLSKQVESVATAVSDKSAKERVEKAETASESMELSEAETRYLIDEQLRRFGWEADTNNLRYSKGSRPQKGRNLAIAE